MANLRTIQFLRNAQIYPSLEAAKEGLALQANNKLDGSPLIGRYLAGEEERSILGLVHVSGSTTGVTFFMNEKEFDNILDGLDYGPIGGTDASVLTQIQQADGKISGLTANVGTLKLTGYEKGSSSGAVEATDSLNVGIGKLEKRIDGEVAAINATIDGLDADSVSGDSKVVIDVTQEDGQITATAANITGVKLAGYAEASDVDDVAETDTLGQALGKLQKTIHEMDKDADAVAGQVVTTVSEADGVVSETKANVKDLQLGGYAKTNDTGAIASADTINVALSKLENKAAAITIDNEDGSINVATATSGTDISVVIKSGEAVLAKDGGEGLYTDLDLVKITTGLPATVKERYQLLATDDSQIGTNIDIQKDSSIVSIELVNEDPTQEPAKQGQFLKYTYVNVSGDTEAVYVDVSRFLVEAEFESGVTANAAGVVHGVVDSASETFLTVGANGFKLSGVQDAINSAVAGLDSTGGTQTIATGKHVAVEVIETDGKITAVNVAEDDIASAQGLADEITARGEADTELSNRLGTGVTTANTATAQLIALSGDSNSVSGDTSVEGAKRYADAILASSVADLDADVSGNSTHVTVNVVEENGVITDVNVEESNIANADDLATLSAKTITKLTSANNSISISDGTIAEDGTMSFDFATDASKISGLTAVADVAGEISGVSTTDSVQTGIKNLYDSLAAEIAARKAAISSTTVYGSDAIDVTSSESGDTVSLILDESTTGTGNEKTGADNALTITNAGLFLSTNWECGTF